MGWKYDRWIHEQFASQFMLVFPTWVIFLNLYFYCVTPLFKQFQCFLLFQRLKARLHQPGTQGLPGSGPSLFSHHNSFPAPVKMIYESVLKQAWPIPDPVFVLGQSILQLLPSFSSSKPIVCNAHDQLEFPWSSVLSSAFPFSLHLLLYLQTYMSKPLVFTDPRGTWKSSSSSLISSISHYTSLFFDPN